MNIILNGASGSGKGSMAKFLVRDFGLAHISTGNIFRENIEKETELGKIVKSYVAAGEWVPDDITIKVILDRVKQEDCKNGIILDGFPRTLKQAEEFAKVMDIDLVVYINISDETAVTRLGNRYMCTKCNAIHSAKWDDITKCKVCGAELYQREDDKAETIKTRLHNFNLNNQSIIDFYKEQGNLFEIKDKVDNSPEDTYNIVKEYINKK